MSQHKFECGKCGQRLSATSDEVGLEANCPTCGEPLVIPPPKTETSPTASPATGPTVEMERSTADAKAPAERAQPRVVEEKPPRPISPKLAAAIAATKAFGLTYRDPDWVDEKGEEFHVQAIDAFFAELYRLTDLMHEMEATGEITRLPDAEELQTIRVLLFEAFLRGQWGGTEEELKTIIFQGTPGVRGS